MIKSNFTNETVKILKSSIDKTVENIYTLDLIENNTEILSYTKDVNDTLRMYKNDDIRMYNFDCITDTIVEVITTCNTYTLLTVHLL